MQVGSFFCYVPKPSPWFLPRTKSAEKQVLQRIDAIVAENTDEQADYPGNSIYTNGPSSADSGLYRPSEAAQLQQTHKYIYSGGGVIFRPWLRHIASELYHVYPYVYGDEKRVIVLFGHISNLADLLRDRELHDGAGSAIVADEGSSVASTTATLVLDLYFKTAPGDELLLLSSLQGQYALVIYDSTRRQVFAARDPSGQHPLFYRLENSGALCLTNNPAKLPATVGGDPWLELLPGHYMTGKKVEQFALTPEELSRKESLEFADGGWNLRPAGLPVEALRVR